MKPVPWIMPGLILLTGWDPLSVSSAALPVNSSQEYISWTAACLKEMKSIKPGMTRLQLLKVFHPAGGLYVVPTNTETFSYQKCDNFKVNIKFKPASEPNKDKIVAISKPFYDRVYFD